MYLHYHPSCLLHHGTAPCSCHPVLPWPVFLQRRATQSQLSVAGRHAGDPDHLSTSDTQRRILESPVNPPEAYADVRQPPEQPVPGRIHSTDSCTMLDGQGVRFMVFMQVSSCVCTHPGRQWSPSPQLQSLPASSAQWAPSIYEHVPYMLLTLPHQLSEEIVFGTTHQNRTGCNSSWVEGSG